MSKGKLFVISGASGVGKSTVLERVMAARKDLAFSVSATTRAPREGEVDGVHYYFITRPEFEAMIQRGEAVGQACLACGFSDYTGFYRAFKAEYGISPREYAQSAPPIP